VSGRGSTKKLLSLPSNTAQYPKPGHCIQYYSMAAPANAVNSSKLFIPVRPTSYVLLNNHPGIVLRHKLILVSAYRLLAL
jgi:hypothetical protein